MKRFPSATDADRSTRSTSIEDFQKISFRSGVQRIAHVVVVGVHAEDQHCGARQVLHDFFGRLHAVQFRHRKVHDHHLGLQLMTPSGWLRRRSPLRPLPSCLHRLRECDETTSHQAMIVRQQNSDFFTHDFSQILGLIASLTFGFRPFRRRGPRVVTAFSKKRSFLCLAPTKFPGGRLAAPLFLAWR